MIVPDEIYALIVRSIRDYAVFALDPTGRILTWNPGAQALKGYREHEIVGRHFSLFYPDEDVARGKPAHELSVAADYGHYEDEGWRVRRDGSRFWANVLITAMRHPDTGELVGFSKVTRDLTDRRQAEEALRRSEERYRLLVGGVSDYAIFLLDTSGHVQSWNTGAERLHGYRAGEIVGEHIRRFYPRDEVGKAQIELDTAAREDRYEDEGWRVRKDGRRFWANVIVTALRDPRDGRLLGFSKVTRDLTDRRQSEQSLRQAYRDLEAFSYTVSHDLRGPLRGIIEIAEVARERTTDQDLVADLKMIAARALEGATLAENLLRFARASAGDLREEPVELAPLAREVGTRLSNASEHKVRFDVEDAPEMRVTGDAALLRIVIENLLSNAWKFSRGAPDPHVTFGVEPDEMRVGPIFVVRDNGVGFDQANARKLFEPFQRLHSQIEFPGSGVGLATVQRIVQRHGGEVWAESQPGKGAAFYFTLSSA